MKIGFYLAYFPSINISFVKEGLGRYIARLITLLMNDGHEIVIACPTWLTRAIYELFEENNIPSERIKIVTPSGESFLWKIIKKRYQKVKKPRQSFRSKLLNATYEASEYFIDILVRLKNFVALILLGILGIVCGIIVFPFAIVFGIIYFILKMICKLFKCDLKSLSPVKVVKKVITLNGRINSFVQFLFCKGISSEISEKLRMDAAKDLIRKINKMKEPADIWFSPMAYWAEFNEISSVTVTCFPDITPSFFPVGFSGVNMLKSVNNVRDAVKCGKYFIVYSEYQRQQVLSANLGIDVNHIRSISISSFVNNTLEDIDVSKVMGQYHNTPIQCFSRSLLKNLTNHASKDVKKYLTGSAGTFSFEDTRYIFYSSQARSNKNLLNLIKAYEYLLREKEVVFKLFLTCNLEHVPDLKKYVYEHRLQYDVLCFSSVSNQLLAAMYASAELVVNPTLYEGGFPLTFSEGMSVGVPSVMGTIPQVMDVVTEFGLSEYMFDPFNYKDIAKKIMFGIENRDLLFEKEKPLFQKLCEDRDNVGKEYVNAFKYFIKLDKEKKDKVS